MGLLTQPQLRKDSLSLRLSQQESPKLKSKEDKDQKKQTRISKECGVTTKGIIYT